METTKAKMIPLGQLLSDSWRDYKLKFVRIIKLSLLQTLAIVPIGIIAAIGFLLFLFNGLDQLKGILIVILSLLGLVALALLIGFSLVVQAASMSVVRDENVYGVKEALKKGYVIFGGLFWVSLLTTIMILLWGLLFIIPGIIMAVFYSVSTWVYLCENVKGYAALKRSKELVSGYWWPVFWRSIFWPLLMTIVLGIPYMFIEEKSVADSTYASIRSLISFLLAPYSIIYGYHIYKNIVSIKNKKTEPAI